MTQVVPVHYIDMIALEKKLALQLHGDGALAGARQSRQPENPRTMAVTGAARSRCDPVVHRKDIGGFHGDALALIGIALHADDAAAHSIVFVHQNKPPHGGIVHEFIEHHHPPRPQDHLGHGVTLHFFGLGGGQIAGVDHSLNGLDNHIVMRRGQFKLVGLAHDKRLAPEPEYPRPENIGLHREVFHVAGDLAALDEDLVCQRNANGLPG